jgi:hypothetical protein
VVLEDLVLDEVIHNVEGHHQIGGLPFVLIEQEEVLGAIAREELLASGNGCLAHIEAQVTRILGKAQLVASPQPSSITEWTPWSETNSFR